MEQLSFDFDFTETPQPIKNQYVHQERCTCAVCGREYLYTEYTKVEHGRIVQDREKNEANPSWINYCSRGCFIKGFCRTWKHSPHFVDLLHINGISYDEMREARADA